MATYKQVSYGSKGSDVTKLQELLNQNGSYNLATDGIFGDKTKAAVMDYQKNKNLAVDGIVGENTWGALTNAQNTAASTPTTPAASTAPAATSQATPTAPTAPTFEYKESDAVAQANALLQQQLANKPGEWQGGTWTENLNDTINQILNREKFSYDLNGDMLYQQYKDQYTTQGKLAMMDTMGQAAALTGGYGSSYGQSVGQQAYQGYLQQLNDVVPELYGMALDQYNQEGQNLYNQASLMAQMDDQEYGRYRDQVSDYYTDLNYLTENARYMSETEYQKALDDFNIKYGAYRDDVSDMQWQTTYDEGVRQYNQNFAYQQDQDALAEAWRQKEYDLQLEQWDFEKSQASADGSGNNNATFANTLWTATGTYDDSGNAIFRNSEGKTQAFAPGINPYTGTKHADAKNGTFSNGYQPNNIGGTKLKNSGMSTTITGKSQTIWEANGKYWLWRGDLNKYIEVDISDID